MVKRSASLLISIILLLSVAVPNVQAKQTSLYWMAKYENEKRGLPSTFGGLRVLAVLTPDNTACLPSGEKRLVLRTDQPDIETFLKTSSYNAITEDLQQKGYKEFTKWNVEIVGPGATDDQFFRENENWNQKSKDQCIKLQPVRIGNDYQEFKGPANGYADYEDTDAGLYSDDNAQSVNLIAPSAIGNTAYAVAFLNNVRPDNSTFYLLQNGLMFINNTGSVVWTDSTKNLASQTYHITYTASHTYWVTISYTNSLWWMCARDNSVPGSYTCISESNAVGTSLAADINTNISVENQNPNSTWYSGFSNPLQAWGAQIYRNGNGQNWGSQHHHTTDNCSTNYPPQNALGGSMIGGSTGNFYLNGVPLRC